MLIDAIDAVTAACLLVMLACRAPATPCIPLNRCSVAGSHFLAASEADAEAMLNPGEALER